MPGGARGGGNRETREQPADNVIETVEYVWEAEDQEDAAVVRAEDQG